MSNGNMTEGPFTLSRISTTQINAANATTAAQRTMGINFDYTPSGSISYDESNGQPSKPPTVAFMWVLRYC